MYEKDTGYLDSVKKQKSFTKEHINNIFVHFQIHFP